MADKSPFRPSYLKLERARQQIAELTQIVDAWVASDPVKVSTRPLKPEEAPEEMKRHGFIVGYRANVDFVKAPPEATSAILGDIFHNLRSSLDLMAGTLAVLNGKSPKKVYFPFAKDAAALEEQITDKNFDRAGEDAIKLLREYRPYKGGNADLRAIHDLNVMDKHQQLIVQMMGTKLPIFGLEGGAPYLNFPTDCDLKNRELISTCHQLVEMTTSIIEAFEALSAPAG